MYFDIIITIITIGALSILWRKTSRESELIRSLIQQSPTWIQNTSRCGLCFSVWIALPAVILIDPFAGWTPSLRWETLPAFEAGTAFFMAWLTVGIGAAFVRFAWTLLVNAVHTLGK